MVARAHAVLAPDAYYPIPLVSECRRGRRREGDKEGSDKWLGQRGSG